MRRRWYWRQKENEEAVDFHYHTEIDYENGTNGCDCEDMCRCSTIENARVESFSVPSATSMVLEKFFPISRSRKNPVPRDARAVDPVFLYCLGRILHRLKPEDFEVEVRGGYYGEEISRVILLDEKPLSHLFELTSSREWVEHVLALEYGYVHEDLKGRDWVAEVYPTKSVVVPNTYRKLSADTIKQYQDELKPLPYGKKPFEARLSCLCSGDYKLVDGYHRLRASIESGSEEILVVRPKKENEENPE